MPIEFSIARGKFLSTLAFLTLTGLLTGCGVAKQYPSKNMQFCFTKEKDVNSLRELSLSIARRESMEYEDLSEITYERLKDPKLNNLYGMRKEQFIMLWVGNDGEIGFWVGNLAGGADQAMVSVSSRDDPKAYEEFVERVKTELSKNWKLFISEGGTPNYPLDCKAK